MPGRVFGELDSRAAVHMEDGVLTAKIETPEEIYHIEPSWRHLEGETPASSNSMIAYKESDIKFSWNYPNEENFTPPKVSCYTLVGVLMLS